MKFEVTILGSSSATPIFNRNPSSQALNINERLYLIDCGEGTQQQMLRFDVKASRIDHIFISHLHGDHYLGLVGLLSSMHLNGRSKPLYLVCPPRLKEIIDLELECSDTRLEFPMNYVFTNNQLAEVVIDNADVTVETIPLDHGVPCTGFLFKEKKRLRKLLKEKVADLGIPVEFYSAIKRGADYTYPDGRTIKNDEVTLDSNDPRTYAYCSDTQFNMAYFAQVSHATMLYHEATFLHNMLERAIETRHTTALQAAEVAQQTYAVKLLIGHFSARYKTLGELLDEAQSVFPETELAIEGRTYFIGEQ
jgi:ribonuclease Z